MDEAMRRWIAASPPAVRYFTVTAVACDPTPFAITTRLLAPFSMVAPTPAVETSVLRPMGFPYDYLTYYVSGFSPVVVNSGYQFALLPALADYALWTGVCAALIGITMKILRGRAPKALNDREFPN